MKIIILILSIMVSQYSFAIESTDKNQVKINYKNPMKDLQSSIDEKDYRFIAIYGVGITGATYIHGVNETPIKDENFPFPKKYINAGGCVVTPLTDMKYKYMIDYNKNLIKHLTNNNLLDEMGISKVIDGEQKNIIIK